MGSSQLLRSLCSLCSHALSLSNVQPLKMSLFAVQPNTVMSANEAAPPPPPYIPSEECNATVNEWGVWPADFVELAHDPSVTNAASSAEIESRVRCGNAPVNRSCTALCPDSKCVFKWAYATTAAATACQCSCCLLGLEQCEMRSSSSMPTGMSISIGSSSSDGSGYCTHGHGGSYQHRQTTPTTAVQYFVEDSATVVV
uniref:Uncharacterized protein n=1 Tax=Caenorhabditis japonica TaxID=281687 RepID=A0A8R1I4V4_CAEJA